MIDFKDPNYEVFPQPPYYRPTDSLKAYNYAASFLRNIEHDLYNFMCDGFLPSGFSLDGFILPFFRLSHDFVQGGEVGRFRYLYYQELLMYSRNHSEAIGLVPSPSQQLISLSLFNDSIYEEPNTQVWMCHDSMLDHILMSSGLSWWEIERAALQGFCDALPQLFRDAFAEPGLKYKRPGKVDDPFIPWIITLHRANLYKVLGKRNRRHIADLKSQFVGTPLAGHLRMLDIMCDLPEWLDGNPAILSKYYSLKTSPIAASVIDSIVTTVLENTYKFHKNLIEKGEESPYYHSFDSSLAYNIWNARMTSREKGEARPIRYPKELWMIVADLLNHCPLFLGLPTALSPIQFTPFPDGATPLITGEAVRLRYTRSPQ